MNADPIAEERDLTALLATYVAARAERGAADDLLKTLGDRFKAWLDAHPEDELVDGERGLRAFLQPRRGTPVYDLVAIQERDPVLFERLLKLGCLSVNAAAVKAQGAQVAGVEKYASPTPSSPALQVKEIK